MSRATDPVPNIAFLGRTGAGKSSLINALVQADHRRVGVRPTTQQRAAIRWRAEDYTTLLVDTPGLDEAGRAGTTLAQMIEALARAHLVVWVIPFPARDLDSDLQLLRKVLALDPTLPLIVAASGVDRASRSFDADRFDPVGGEAPHEQKIREWGAYLSETLAEIRRGEPLVLCSAGESADDRERQHNLEGLAAAIDRHLPQASQRALATRSRWSLDLQALALVGTASGAAATAAIVPVPFADVLPITLVQVATVMILVRMHGKTLREGASGGMIATGVAASLGPLLFEQAFKLVPGAGSLIAPGIAAAATLAVGGLTHLWLRSGHPLTPRAIRHATRETWSEDR